MVPLSEIRKMPMGPLVGIPGAPDDLVVTTPPDAGFGLCDHLGSTGGAGGPDGDGADRNTRAGYVGAPGELQAVLASYGGQTYLVTDGHRSQIDLTDKPVTLALGIQSGTRNRRRSHGRSMRR